MSHEGPAGGPDRADHLNPYGYTMLKFIKWVAGKFGRGDEQPKADLRQTGTLRRPRPPRPAQTRPEPKPQAGGVRFRPELEGRIEDGGPGKNVLVRNRYVREDTGTHETLKIEDGELAGEEPEAGFDPYNSGQFDRSRNWTRRPR